MTEATSRTGITYPFQNIRGILRFLLGFVLFLLLKCMALRFSSLLWCTLQFPRKKYDVDVGFYSRLFCRRFIFYWYRLF